MNERPDTSPSASDVFAPRIHSSEIAAHEFPRVRKGLDPEAVHGWLTMIAAAYSELEAEAAVAREQHHRLLTSVRRGRAQAPQASVHAALMNAQLHRRTGGYDRKEVEKLLQSAAAEMARLQNQTTLAEAELEVARITPSIPREISETLAQLQEEVAALRDAAHLPRVREIVLS